MDREELIDRALELHRAIPEWPGVPCLTGHDARVAVGMDDRIAGTDAVKQAHQRKKMGLEQRFGPPIHENNLEANVARTLFIWERLLINPLTFRKVTKTFVMSLAGFGEKDRQAGTAHMRVTRGINALQGAAVVVQRSQALRPPLAPTVPAPLPPMMAPQQMMGQQMAGPQMMAHQQQIFPQQPMFVQQPMHGGQQMMGQPMISHPQQPMMAPRHQSQQAAVPRQANANQTPATSAAANQTPASSAAAPAANPNRAVAPATNRGTAAAPSAAVQPVLDIEFDNSSVVSQSMVSPLSGAANSTAVDFDEGTEEHGFFNAPPVFGNTQMSLLFDKTYSGTVDSPKGPNINWRDARKPAGSITSAISKLTTSTDSRRTSKAVQVERQTRKELDNIRKTMFKVATVLYQSVRLKENTLNIFKSAESICATLNDLTGIDCISGREIQEAVANDRVNMSPPKLGRQGEVPLEVFKAFAHVVFTICAIEQANCKDRSNREQLKTQIGEVLNAKRRADGLPEMNDARFYGRIEEEICHLTDLTKADARESLRVLWLTHHSQLKHYENWEANAIRLGFARSLTVDERPEDDGYIIWKKHRLSHILQFDEMNLALDGTDASIGGRQSLIPSASRAGIKEGGQSAEKSGASMTIMFGINFAGEALPPLFIFPTAAKDPANYKLKVEFASRLPQVKAVHGFDEPRYHNVPFAMNPKGGMTGDMLYDFFSSCVLPLYPKIADTEEQCALAKMDSGPGRSKPETLVKLRSAGLHLYPGMPNGTSTGQELDQMFAYLKKLVYKNRNDLWAARFRIEGESASLSMADMALIVFGGTVILTDGTTLELVDAFATAMDAEHIHKAMDKCGYCPSTRAALKSSQVRHEIMENQDGDVDAVADPHGALLDELEKQNLDAVRALQMEGFDEADKLRRKVKRVTAEQQRGRASTVTAPNTRERQDAIMGAHTAGGFFHVTNGGAPMTCDDVLIAFARKNMEKDAKELEKRKQSYLWHLNVASDAEKVLRSANKDVSKWKKPDLQAVIQWKQGPTPTEPNNEKTTVNKPVLLELWNNKYKDMPAPEIEEWTDADEERLESLLGGEIVDFENDVGLKRCQDTEDDFLALRVLALSRKRRKKILLKVIEGMDEAEWMEILAQLEADEEFERALLTPV